MAEREPDFLYVAWIGAAPERVWEAITSAAFTTRYFFGRSIESDWKTGSPWRLVMADGRTDCEGVVLAAEPPHRLELSWRVVWVEALRELEPTRVIWLIEPGGEVTRLTVAEYHPPCLDPTFREGGRRGWPMILSGLKTLLETGRSLPIEVPEPPG